MKTHKSTFWIALVLTMFVTCGTEGIPVQASSASQAAAVTIRDTSEAARIILNGDSITVEGTGATIDGSTVTITAAGAYSISGTLTDGQIIVDTRAEEDVNLILNGVDISSATSAPLVITNAKDVVITLADNTENRVTDGDSYSFAAADEDEPNAAIFSAADLVITGSGALIVTGNYNDGIASKDDLTISGGTITVSAVDDGIRGKDSLVVEAGTVTVTAGGDGLKSDNAEDATRGYVSIESGAITITAGGDAIQAETSVTITSGELALTSGGGSSARIADDASAKGIKAVVSVTIEGGFLVIDAADDAIHANDSIVINGGTFIIASGDDAIHADSTLAINAGDITITDSYEGLESALITLNGGNFAITSSDDAINVAGGADGSGMFAGPGRGGQRPSRLPGQTAGQAPGQMDQMPGQDAFAAAGSYYLYINGGYISIDAGGDGIDSNGSIEMTAGMVIINGPTQNMNGALDYMGSFNITGGFLVAVGSAGMAQAPSDSSAQASLLLNFNGTVAAGTLVHIQDAAGNDVLTFAPLKDIQSIALSSPDLVVDATYQVFYGGASSGTAVGGLYRDGAYTPGAQYTEFTASGVVTMIGARGRW